MDVCALSNQPHAVRIDDVLDAMETTHNDDTSPATTTTAPMTTTSRVTAAVGRQSTLVDSDVSRSLDVALQNDIDGLLSTISDNSVACSSSTVPASSVATVSNEPDQHYLFYSAQTDELIDTFLRSTNDDSEGDTPVYSELQAVQLTADDWPTADSLSDVQMGGMLVEFDSSLLTIIELQNNQIPVDAEGCLTVARASDVQDVYHGVEVSQFQVITSEQPTAAVEDSSPAAGRRQIPKKVLVHEGPDGVESAATAQSTGSVTDDADCPPDVHAWTNRAESNPDSVDEEYVFIVDCVDGNELEEVEYEIVDEADKATDDSAAATPAESQAAISDISDDDDDTNS